MPKVLAALNYLPVRLALLVLLGLCLPIEAHAEDNSTFECGRNLFKSAKYKDALPYLKSSEASFSYDNRAFYYEALCYHRMGQLNAAMTAYQTVIAKFPDSEAAELSKKAIAGMRGTSPQALPGGSLAKPKAISVDQLPAQLVLKVAEQDGKPVVNALVSGAKVKFVVDTTVPNSVIGSDVAKESKLPEAAVKSKDDYYLHDIKLDTMNRAAFPIQVTNKQPKVAILGADYFEYSTVAYSANKAEESTRSATSAKTGTLTIKRMVGFSNPFEAGLKLFNAGKYKAAYPLLKTSAVNRPRDPRALYLLAVCSQRINKLDEARTNYRNVMQRFPGSEASSLSNFALLSIDPGYAARAQAAQAKSDSYSLLGGVPKIVKRQEFDFPYTPENGYIKVTAQVDGHNVEMYLQNNYGSCVFSTEQIRQIDSSYLDSASDATSKLAEPSNSNNLTETFTRTFKLRRVKLGRIETSNVSAQTIDNSSRTGLTWGGYDRPILGNSAIAGWRYEVLPNRRLLRFTQMN
ncbi:MAG: tetratricopeptide repeat protein [Candidatus Obscuribacterales bacterium]|jgi:tetratricopeptide (TPR) repeat protein